MGERCNLQGQLGFWSATRNSSSEFPDRIRRMFLVARAEVIKEFGNPFMRQVV